MKQNGYVYFNELRQFMCMNFKWWFDVFRLQNIIDIRE